LRIRPFTHDDWQALHAYASDPATMMWIPEGTMSEEQAQAFVAENQVEEAHAHALELRADGTLVGHMIFHPWFAPRTYEVGWVLASQFHGRGYATEAARALIEHGFRTLGLHRIIATCQPENPPSWRVMEKLGMRREAHFVKCIHRGGDTWWSEYFYALLHSEWQQRTGRDTKGERAVHRTSAPMG
jgi:RimJ/RimL family protein N-acetyltransferase